nr:reverse transcriptase domain-containing protein [Tanacetum cinerariifolium]
MRTLSSSNLVGESSPNPTTSNLKRRNRRRSKQPFILEESPVDTMADQRTMSELLRAPTEGYAEAIVVPPILAEHFELKHSLINMMTSDQFFGLEKDNPHDHIRWFNKITSIIKYKDVPNSAIKLMLFPFSLAGAARRWLEKEPPRSILTWEDLVFKFINEFFPPTRTTNLRNEISNFQQRFDESFHMAWDRYKDLLRACPRHGFTELHQLDTFYNALNPVDQDSLNSATGGNLLERLVPLSELEKIKKMNEINIKAMQTQINNVKNELRNEMKTSIQASMSNQTNELKNMMASFFQMNTASTLGSGPLSSNTIANPKGELKAIITRSGLVLDGPSVLIPPPFINPEEDECVEETLTDSELAEYTIKQDKDEIQIHKFWQMFKQLHINITLVDALIPIPKCQKMLKALLSNKEKILEMANTPLNENCSAVILKKLHEKLGDPGKFSFRLPELIFTRMTLELANQAVCTPAGIARDVFVPVKKFTFLADFVIVDYESDPRVPLILGRPFLRTARALIDVYEEEMILRDGDERLTLNMRHDTSSYSNQPQKESINMINIYDDSYEDYLEDLFATNHLSGSLTFSSHTDLTSSEVKDNIFYPEGDIVLSEKFLNLDSTKDLPLLHNINPLSSSTTSSSPNHLLEEFIDELALITFPPRNDDLPFDIEFDLREIEYFLNYDHTKEMDSILKDLVDEDNLVEPNNNLFDTIPEMFTDEHTLDYSSPPLYDAFDDDLDELESDNDDVYNDPFDSKEDKIKESKLLIDELDPPRSSDFLPFLEYDSFLFENFSEVDALPSTNNENKVFNLGILIHENLSKVTVQVTPDKNVKKISISHAFLILEDFNPPLYELPFHKEVLWPETLLSFSSEYKEKVFKLEILTSKGVHSSLLPELSHRGPKAFKVIKNFESPMEIFHCSYGEDIRILEVLCLHFYPS